MSVSGFTVVKSNKHIPSERAIRAILDRYHCPTPYHEVRTRFLGAIACPMPVKPLEVVKSLWGGELPPIESIDDLNVLLDALVMGLWNALTAHQDVRVPFRVSNVPLEPTPANLAHFGAVRASEIEGFVEGLFNGAEHMALPERAHEAVTHLGEIRAMMAGIPDLVERTADQPVNREQIKRTLHNLRSLTEILEKEIHEAVLACSRARTHSERAAGLPGLTAPWESRH